LTTDRCGGLTTDRCGGLTTERDGRDGGLSAVLAAGG
jgi:hypothetical protein